MQCILNKTRLLVTAILVALKEVFLVWGQKSNDVLDSLLCKKYYYCRWIDSYTSRVLPRISAYLSRFCQPVCL